MLKDVVCEESKVVIKHSLSSSIFPYMEGLNLTAELYKFSILLPNLFIS